MYIERMIVQNFRHLRKVEFGPFREPRSFGDLIVLAGPNGSGKSSVLELLSYALASRYSWQFFQNRAITDHSFAIKIGFTQSEIEQLTGEIPHAEVTEYMRQVRGYWMHVNFPDIINPAKEQVNGEVHGLVTRQFQRFARKLGFFVRADRGYAARSYNRNQLFSYKRRQESTHFNTISYMSTAVQYEDMYDFLVEQNYHYIYNLGLHSRNGEKGIPSERPQNPLLPYNELLGQLFPGYSFSDVNADDDLTLRVQLPTGDTIPFQDLSSGEKEVFFLLSFFIRHNVTDSVIVVDEPELHLHPELARKLIRLMRDIRPGNQCWCATHSAELIDEAGRDRTFYLRSSDDRSHAECIPATTEGSEITILRDMFGISGYVGISRKIVFSEGMQSSADRKTFVNLFPELSRDIKLIAAGSVTNLYRINQAILNLLESDFARCQFYLIRDRDYLSTEALENHRASLAGRLFILSRYHIENYLLDVDAIADVLRTLYNQTLSGEAIREQLQEIAREQSAAFLRDMVVARVNELYQPEDYSIRNHSNGLAVMTKAGQMSPAVVDPLRIALLERITTVNTTISERTSSHAIEHLFDRCLREVTDALQGDGWISLFPGRTLLQRLSSKMGLGRWPGLQNMLIERLAKGDIPVNPELTTIFTTISR